jgi:PAS domain S-box-containing protein
MIEDRAFFRRLVEKNADAIVSIDEESTVLFANEAVDRVFGYEPEELVGESLLTLVPDRYQDAHESAVHRYVETGERGLDWTDIRLPGEHRDGHEVPLSITFEEHDHGDERVFSGIIRDVTDQRAYERTLESLQTTAREFLRARNEAEIGDVAVTAAAEVLDLPMAALYRYEPTSEVLRPTAWTEVVADRVGDLAPVGDGDDPWRAFAAGETRRYDPTGAGPWGDSPARNLLAVPLGDRGLLLAGTDDGEALDDRTATLAGVLAANAEAALNRAEREAELERRNEQLERFASILSHDLRDPLNAARAQVALARDDHDSRYLRDLESIHDRMGELVEDVLALAREGRAVGETTAVDLGGVVAAAWETVGTEAATLTVEGDLGTVNADRERLRTLLENVLGNAVRHGGGSVTVRVGSLATTDGFFVADDGPGIPAEDREAVFEYGYTTREDGTGLGLDIVRRIGDANGWQVRAAESEAGGARIEFEFGATPKRVDGS